MKPKYLELNVDEIELDMENPRIAKYLEMYGKENLNSEVISLALGGGTNDDKGTSYNTLKESIKANKGIINPIMVNKTTDGRFIVIEGNTRVQIYKEFKKYNVDGDWEKISALVFENLNEDEKDAIRLQSHLVGPREWDPYSKAKYLNYLSNSRNLPMSQIISFCGGNQAEIIKLIEAYNEMETYYRDNLDDDSEFDQRDFSKFYEFQRKTIKEAILRKGYTIENFAKWVIDGNIDTAINVRKIPQIFESKEAIEVFLKSNISEAEKKVVIDDGFDKTIENIPYYVLANQLNKKINSMDLGEFKSLKFDTDKENEKNILIDLYENMKWLIKEFDEEN